MYLLQIISVTFGLFMLYVVHIHKKKKNLDPFEYGVWIGLWSCFIFLAIFPQTIAGIAQRLSIGRVFDLLVIISLMIISVLTLLNRVDQKRIEKKLEDITRKRAFDEQKTRKR